LNAPPAVNGVSYFQMIQQQEALFLLSDFETLQLRCGKLPVVAEQYSSDQSSNSVFQNIMTDFIPIKDNSFNNHSVFQYQPTVWRWFTLTSTNSLREMDLGLFYQTVTGQTFPIILTFNKVALVKLAFRKKKIYSNGK
jgi:hypothetical protein